MTRKDNKGVINNFVIGQKEGGWVVSIKDDEDVTFILHGSIESFIHALMHKHEKSFSLVCPGWPFQELFSGSSVSSYVYVGPDKTKTSIKLT